MKLSKILVAVSLGLTLMMIQSVHVELNGADGWVTISVSEAEASQNRRVARRTSRRTAKRQTCGSSWC
jgi:hypothetical protein